MKTKQITMAAAIMLGATLSLASCQGDQSAAQDETSIETENTGEQDIDVTPDEEDTADMNSAPADTTMQ